MQYLISFFEGIITFISPCLLPMLPIYIMYFMGEDDNRAKTWVRALGFVLGFTIIFVLLGAFAGTLGGFIIRYKTVIQIVGGGIIIILGLNYMGILKIGFLNRTMKPDVQVRLQGFFSSMLFGAVFSIGWTPCVGTFLGSALILASQQGTALKGILMLLAYSAGLGVPFLISALLIDRLKGAFDFIKQHYDTVNRIAGFLLILMGIAMATGLLDKLLGIIQ